MEFRKLFETQKVLMDRIEKEHPVIAGEERSSKRLLALLVEIGECANEQRSWKFWSKDQEPRTKGKCKMCSGDGYYNNNGDAFDCPMCEGSGVNETKNPLLEELVDGLHFVLEEGLEFGLVDYDYLENLQFPDAYTKHIAGYFIDFYRAAINFFDCPVMSEYKNLVSEFVYLASALGFEWSEIVEGYMEKNKENHARQDRSY